MKLRGNASQIEVFLDRTLSGPVFTWRQILDLIVPGVLDSLSVMLCGMLITALISKNGESSVAAVSLVNPIMWMITNIFNGISAGGTVIVAQCCGRQDKKMLQQAIGMTMWLTIGVGIVVCLPCLLFPDTLLGVLYPQAEAVVMEKARVYLAGTIWSVLVFTVYTASFAVLRGLGECKRCLTLSVIINVGFLVFSILFLNILKLDILGSVYALFLARVAGSLASVVLLFAWRPPVRMKARMLLAYDQGLLRSSMHISIPLGLEQMCASLAGVVSQMYMVPLGTTALATHAIVNSLMGVLYAPASSGSNLAVTVVGRCIGAAEYGEAKRYGKRCDQITMFLIAAAALVFYPCLPFLLKQYNPTPEAGAMAVKLLYYSLPALFFFWPTSNTMPSTLRAANDAVFPSALSLAVLWGVNIGLGYILAIPAGYGIWGVWVATWVSWVVRFAGFELRFQRGKWLKKAEKGI